VTIAPAGCIIRPGRRDVGLLEKEVILLKHILIAACALSLSACGVPGVAGMPTGTVTKQDTVVAVASTAAAVADAIGQAPPATLSKTTIDEKAVNLAFRSFDRALTFIDRLISDGDLPKGSPRAVAVASGIRAVKGALNTASHAQRAGNATTYSAALRQANAALESLQSTLAR
jgi:hypothetical protein